MQFSKEILRGVRLAAILFAVLLVTVTSYRMLRVAPAPVPRPERPEVAPPPAPVAAVSSEPVNPEVPPPPPVGGRAPVRRTTRQAAVKTPPVMVLRNVEAVVTVAAPPPGPTEPAPAPAARTEEKTEPVQPAPVAVEKAAVAPNTSDDNTQKSGPRGKRLLRSVGRFFHVGGKKDTETQAVRQP